MVLIYSRKEEVVCPDISIWLVVQLVLQALFIINKTSHDTNLPLQLDHQSSAEEQLLKQADSSRMLLFVLAGKTCTAHITPVILVLGKESAREEKPSRDLIQNTFSACRQEDWRSTEQKVKSFVCPREFLPDAVG